MTTWPRRPWPPRPRRNHTWLLERLTGAMRARGIRTLSSTLDLLWACAFVDRTVGCSVYLQPPRPGLVRIHVSADCPTDEVSAVWVAFEGSTPAGVQVETRRLGRASEEVAA